MNTEKVTIYIEPAGRNIYDLADNFTQRIALGRRYQYAVVAPAYYRIPPTRHNTLGGVIRRVKELSDYDGVRVINRKGRDGQVINFAGDYELVYAPIRDNCITAVTA